MRPALLLLLPFAALALGAPAWTKADEQMSWRPDTIPWQSRGADGTRFALLEGDRDRANGAFSYAFFIPAGVWDGPHSHSATARVFVASGTLRLGYGSSGNHVAAKTYPAGSYVIVPAGAVHYDGASADTLLFGTATGPWTTRYLDGGGPTSAGTPIR